MIAEIIVDVMSSEVDRVFDYLVPESFSHITIGYRVKVPFGNRQIEGYVVRLKETTDCPIDKLKAISAILDDYPLIKPELINLIHYMKDYLYLRLLDGIKLAVPSQVRTGVKDKIERIIILNDDKVQDFLVTLNKRNKNAPLVIQYLQSKGKENYTRF